MNGQDIKIEVYEAAEKFSEIGAGFGFWSRPWKILKKLGLTDSATNVNLSFTVPGPFKK